MGQPAAETFALDRPGLAVAVDIDVGKASPVWNVKEARYCGESDQRVGRVASPVG